VARTVRVNRPGTTLFTPIVEYHGRVVSVDVEDQTVEVLDDERKYPGEPGGIRREKVSDCHVGWWERVWHDGEREPLADEPPAERGSQ
jgi:hypothetical protein